MPSHWQPLVTRRLFMGTISSVGVGCCTVPAWGQETSLVHGDFPAREFGCTPVEATPDNDELYRTSIEAAADPQIGNRLANLAEWRAGIPALADLDDRAAAAAIMDPARSNFDESDFRVQSSAVDAVSELDDEVVERELIPQRMALLKGKIWGRNPLRIFVARTRQRALRDAIDDAIQIWNEVIGLQLRTTQSSIVNDISIGYGFNGFFSAVGTDSAVPGFRDRYGGQSLNIRHSVPGYDRARYRAVALHELGHALGAVHEHQSPGGDIPWDEPALVRHYSQAPNHWDLKQVRYQITKKFNRAEVSNSSFDKDSIMLYPVKEAFLIKDPQGRWREYVTGWNQELSDRDMQFMQGHYGVGTKGDVTAVSGSESGGRLNTSGAVQLELGSKITADLSEYADQDVYRIDVRSTGTYIVETVDRSPATNIRLELFEPGDLSSPIADQAYGGDRLLNARIVKQLKSGTYFVRATHRNRPGRGSYTIRFRPKP